MNQSEESPKYGISNEELISLLSDDEEEEIEVQPQSRIEDIDTMTLEEKEQLKNNIEYTKNNIEYAKLINDLTIEYNDPGTDVFRKLEIEKAIRAGFGENIEQAERVINHIKNNGEKGMNR